MDFFLDQIEIVLPVLGLDILRPIAPTPIRSPEATSANPPHAAAATITTPPEFVFKIGSSTDAKGVEVNNEFIVKAGSIGRDVETESLPKAYRAIRDQLKADKSLEIENGQLVFKRDIAFTSPTAAACVVYGASISGPANWHVDDTNETYADYRTRSLGAAEAGAGAGNGG